MGLTLILHPGHTSLFLETAKIKFKNPRGREPTYGAKGQEKQMPPKLVYFLDLHEGPLKMMKNVFYCIVKVLLVLKVSKFLSRHFGPVGKTASLER